MYLRKLSTQQNKLPCLKNHPFFYRCCRRKVELLSLSLAFREAYHCLNRGLLWRLDFRYT